MLSLLCCCLIPGQIETVDSASFSKELQQAAVLATVQVTNVSREVKGSGVIIGSKGPCVYILTAQHIIDKADSLEVEIFSAASFPQPHRMYRSVAIVAQTGDIQDLALLRVTTDDQLPKPLPLCPARLVSDDKGFEALSVGCADGNAPTCLVDKVLAKRLIRREAEDKAAHFWEIDRIQQEGRSGGPLVDKRGYLIGVCSGTNREKSYFCHTEEISRLLATERC